jgi:hypothetical protein
MMDLCFEADPARVVSDEPTTPLLGLQAQEDDMKHCPDLLDKGQGGVGAFHGFPDLVLQAEASVLKLERAKTFCASAVAGGVKSPRLVAGVFVDTPERVWIRREEKARRPSFRRRGRSALLWA